MPINPNPATVGDLISNADESTQAAADASVAAAAANAALADAAKAEKDADHSLSTALVATGPVFQLGSDGQSVTIYRADDTETGYHTEKPKFAGSEPIPGGTPEPVPEPEPVPAPFDPTINV